MDRFAETKIGRIPKLVATNSDKKSALLKISMQWKFSHSIMGNCVGVGINSTRRALPSDDVISLLNCK